MKNFKKYLVFVLAISLSFQQSIHAAASSVPVEPATQPTAAARLADYLAGTRFFTWLGNKITIYTLEAHEARVKNKKQRIRKKYAEHYLESGRIDFEQFEGDLRSCDFPEWQPSASTTLTPKKPLHYALIIIQLGTQLLPNTTRYPSKEEHDYLLRYHETKTLVESTRIHEFDVCHDRPNMQQCCTIYDNTHIKCCLIDATSGLKVCADITLQGYPEQIHTFDRDAFSTASPLDFQSLSEKLTTTESATFLETDSSLMEPYYLPSCGFVVIDKKTFFPENKAIRISTIAHELGHHQQSNNNPGFYKHIRDTEKFYPISIRAFNHEFNADIHSYLLTENHDIIQVLLALSGKKSVIVSNDNRCSLPHFLHVHPDKLTCRIPLLAELHEKYPPLVKELETEMAHARAEQAKSSSAASSSSQ